MNQVMLNYRTNAIMANHKPNIHLDGSPLAVCINDCEIDFGQPEAELSSLCFRLGCAFAEMRWGSLSQKGKTAANSSARRTYQIESGKSLE